MPELGLNIWIMTGAVAGLAYRLTLSAKLRNHCRKDLMGCTVDQGNTDCFCRIVHVYDIEQGYKVRRGCNRVNQFEVTSVGRDMVVMPFVSTVSVYFQDRLLRLQIWRVL